MFFRTYSREVYNIAIIDNVSNLEFYCSNIVSNAFEKEQEDQIPMT